MKWVVDNDREFFNVDDLCDYLFDPDNYDDDDACEEWIDDMYSGVEIAGHEFTASEIVRECNSDVWDDLKNEWAESQAENDRDYYYRDLEQMDDGESEYYNGYEVEFFDDPEEDEDEESWDSPDDSSDSNEDYIELDLPEGTEQVSVFDFLTNFQTI